MDPLPAKDQFLEHSEAWTKRMKERKDLENQYARLIQQRTTQYEERKKVIEDNVHLQRIEHLKNIGPTDVAEIDDFYDDLLTAELDVLDRHHKKALDGLEADRAKMLLELHKRYAVKAKSLILKSSENSIQEKDAAVASSGPVKLRTASQGNQAPQEYGFIPNPPILPSNGPTPSAQGLPQGPALQDGQQLRHIALPSTQVPVKAPRHALPPQPASRQVAPQQVAQQQTVRRPSYSGAATLQHAVPNANAQRSVVGQVTTAAPDDISAANQVKHTASSVAVNSDGGQDHLDDSVSSSGSITVRTPERATHSHQEAQRKGQNAQEPENVPAQDPRPSQNGSIFQSYGQPVHQERPANPDTDRVIHPLGRPSQPAALQIPQPKPQALQVPQPKPQALQVPQSKSQLPQVPQSKRKIDEGFEVATNQAKRSKMSEVAHNGASQSVSGPSARTITFDEVYQDGKANYKHFIIEHKGQFYILKCDQHGVHFKQNPLAGAAKHLASAQHGNLSKEHSLALEKLGFLVVDCTTEKFHLNNKASQDAFNRGYVALNLNHLNKKERKSMGFEHGLPANPNLPELQPAPGPHTLAPASALPTPAMEHPRPSMGITRPVPGQLYLGYWAREKKNYAVIMLPWDRNLGIAGLPRRTLHTIGLLKRAPRCYVIKKNKVIGWAEGYEEGGQYESKREFPVMYFDKSAHRSVGWLQARNLSAFNFDDPNKDNIPFFQDAINHYEYWSKAGPHERDEDSETEQSSTATVQAEETSPQDESAPPSAISASAETALDGQSHPASQPNVKEQGENAVPVQMAPQAPVADSSGKDQEVTDVDMVDAAVIDDDTESYRASDDERTDSDNDIEMANTDSRRTSVSNRGSAHGGDVSDKAPMPADATQQKEAAGSAKLDNQSQANGLTAVSESAAIGQAQVVEDGRSSGPITAADQNEQVSANLIIAGAAPNSSASPADAATDAPAAGINKPLPSNLQVRLGSPSPEQTDIPPTTRTASRSHEPRSRHASVSGAGDASRRVEKIRAHSNPLRSRSQTKSQSPTVAAAILPGKATGGNVSSSAKGGSLSTREESMGDKVVQAANLTSRQSPALSSDVGAAQSRKPVELSTANRTSAQQPLTVSASVSSEAGAAPTVNNSASHNGTAQPNGVHESTPATPSLAVTAASEGAAVDIAPTISTGTQGAKLMSSISRKSSMDSARSPAMAVSRLPAASPVDGSSNSRSNSPALSKAATPAAFIKSDPSRSEVFEICAYNDDTGRSFKQEEAGTILCLYLNTDTNKLESESGAPIEIAIDAKNIAKLLVHPLSDPVGRVPCKVTVYTNAPAKGEQTLVFDSAESLGRKEAGRIHARRFCRWAMTINKAIEYRNNSLNGAR